MTEGMASTYCECNLHPESQNIWGDGSGKLFPNSLVKSLSYICGLQIVNMSGYLDFVDSSRYQINMESVLFNNHTHDVIINNILNMTKNYKI